MWEFAGSRNFSVFVFVMSITFALILAVFRIGFRVEERWLYIVADLWPYKLLYALFFLNLIVLGIGWVPAVIRVCRLAPLPERLEQAGRSGSDIEVPATGFRFEDLRQFLRRRGYRVRGAEGHHGDLCSTPGCTTLVYASKGRYSLIGNLLFHAGFLLVLAGAGANALYSFAGTAILAEGDAFTGTRKEYRTTAAGRWSALPEADFDVEKISADLWEGRMLFTRLEAQLLHSGGRGIARVNDGVRVGNAQVSIAGYGYAPKFALKNADGLVVDMGAVKLNLISPGAEDYFYIPGYPHKIFLSFHPDHAQVNGKIVNRSMNPVNPAYFLRILRGRIPVYTGLVKPGEWAQFDGLSIAFPSFVRSAEFRVFRNPGDPAIWTAFAMMILGLAWRLLYYRKEVLLWRDGAGRTWLSGRADYYPKLHAAWLASLAGQFEGSPP